MNVIQVLFYINFMRCFNFQQSLWNYLLYVLLKMTIIILLLTVTGNVMAIMDAVRPKVGKNQLQGSQKALKKYNTSFTFQINLVPLKYNEFEYFKMSAFEFISFLVMINILVQLLARLLAEIILRAIVRSRDITTDDFVDKILCYVSIF